MNYAHLFDSLLMEMTLVAGALLVLAVDLLFGKNKSHGWRIGVAAMIGVIALCAAGGFAINFFRKFPPEGYSAMANFVLDINPFIFVTKLCVLVLSGLTLLLIGGTSRLKNPAEHVALTLFATAGFTLMAAANNLLVIFLALELASLSLYILAGFDKTRPESAEAGLKYFLYGSVAAAFLLFGFSLIYGLTGEINLPAIAVKLRTTPLSPLLLVSCVMILVGFGYKTAAAPFHLWAPDAYQGAPTTSAALIASASKVAGFVLLARLLSHLYNLVVVEHTTYGWVGILVLLAVASLLLGNIAALAQSNVRRLLAYSAIAHAGVLLIAVLPVAYFYSDNYMGTGFTLLYYLFTYGLATIGAFGVIAVAENSGGFQKISDLAGLWKRSRLLTLCLLVFILSLAGVPPLAGFFAKFSVFAQTLAFAAETELPTLYRVYFWLVILAIALSAVALYYYLQILKAAFITPPRENETTPLRTPWPAAVALVLAAVALVVLGIYPKLVLL